MAGPILLTAGGSIALQGSGIALYDQSALEDCCCVVSCSCEDIGGAVIGADFDIALSGFVDGDCDDCDDSLNDTFSFLDVPTALFACGTSVASDVIITGCSTYSVQLDIDAFPHGIKVTAVSDALATFHTFFIFQLPDICSVLADLIAGNPINIPLVEIIPNGGDNDVCDTTATPTCTLTRTAPP